ncbi:hypothetical protein RFI_13756, partial [Reticulomyxa filosa]
KKKKKKRNNKKIECALKEEWNPLKQNMDKGTSQLLNYHNLPFNYGFMPQTWDNPHQPSRYSDIGELKGDDGPLDVVEISGTHLSCGQVVPIKVLNILGLVDEEEINWKVIGIRADHPKAEYIDNHKVQYDPYKLINIEPTTAIADADRILETQLQESILSWFAMYKASDEKPEKKFTHNGNFQSPEMAVEVIESVHRQWYDLMLGAAKSDNSLQSVTRKHLIAQGLTKSYEEYELEEEAPDQQKRNK